jgi:hypothetical protein
MALLVAGLMALSLTAAADQSVPLTLRFQEQRLGPAPSDIDTMVFSADRCHLAMVVTRQGKQLVVVDGQAGPAYDGIAALIFSPDGKRMAYGAGKGEKRLVVVDGQAGPEYDGIKGGPTFHADGTLEYLAVKSGGLYRVTYEP